MEFLQRLIRYSVMAFMTFIFFLLLSQELSIHILLLLRFLKFSFRLRGGLYLSATFYLACCHTSWILVINAAWVLFAIVFLPEKSYSAMTISIFKDIVLYVWFCSLLFCLWSVRRRNRQDSGPSLLLIEKIYLVSYYSL